jgi:hypothetical protein
MCNILKCPSIVNYEISKYITELDHRCLIQSNKIIRSNFLIKEILSMYRKKILPFITHLSSLNYLRPVQQNNLSKSICSNSIDQNDFNRYPSRPKFYKKNINKEYEIGFRDLSHDFCSKSFVSDDMKDLHIESIHGKIDGYIDEKNVISLSECHEKEGRYEAKYNIKKTDKVRSDKKSCVIKSDLFKEYVIAEGDHMGIDGSYGIAIISHWYNHLLNTMYCKYIHIFLGESPLMLSRHLSISMDMLNEHIDIKCTDNELKIMYSYPFLVIPHESNIIVIDTGKLSESNSKTFNKIDKTAIRTYHIPNSEIMRTIYFSLNRGHILSWIMTDLSWLKYAYSLDLTISRPKVTCKGENTLATCILTLPQDIYIPSYFIHSSVSKKFCCVINKYENIWLIGDYSESMKPLTIDNLTPIPGQNDSLVLSWCCENNYSYPIFLDITSGNKEDWTIICCSDF